MSRNYSYGVKVTPPGVYYIHRLVRKSGGRTSVTNHFYTVRIPIAKTPGVTTLCKCKTRDEAESAFLGACPDHRGVVPYFEVGDYLLKRKRKRKTAD